MRPSVLGAAVLPLLLNISSVAGQDAPTGFLDRTIMVAGQEHRYQIYVPNTYSVTERWP